MWSHLLPSAQRRHNLLIITQCSVLPDNLVRCITGQLEVPPLSVLQSAWMFARLTRRLCLHTHPPLSWRDLCCMIHAPSTCQYCAVHTNIVKEESKRGIIGTQKSFHCKDKVSLPKRHPLERDGPCCGDLKLIAERCRSMNGLPIIISLQSAQSVLGAYQAKPTLPYTSDGLEKASDLSKVQQSLHSAWLKNYLHLSLPAKQLLSIIAFLHPDQISLRLFLCEDLQCWMPEELFSFVFGSVKEEPVLCSELPRHSLHRLLAELHQHSLISFLPNQGGELEMFSSSNESSLFCLHRLTRQCMLVHLRRSNGQFVRFLQSAIGLVWNNIRQSASMAYTEAYLVPHALQLSPSRLLPDCMEYCNFVTTKPEPRAGFLAFLAIDSSDAQAILMHDWCQLLDCTLQVGVNLWNIHEYGPLRADASFLDRECASYRVNSNKNWNRIEIYYSAISQILRRITSFLKLHNRRLVMDIFAIIWKNKCARSYIESIIRDCAAIDDVDEVRCVVDNGVPFYSSRCILRYKTNLHALLNSGMELIGLFVEDEGTSKAAAYVPESQKENLRQQLQSCITGLTAALDTGLEKSQNIWLRLRRSAEPSSSTPVWEEACEKETTSDAKSCAMPVLSQNESVTALLATLFEGKSLKQPLTLSRLITVSSLYVLKKHRTSFPISHIWIPLSIAVIFYCASGMLVEAKVAMERTHCAVQSASVLELAAQCLELFSFVVVNKEPLYYFLTQEDVCADV